MKLVSGAARWFAIICAAACSVTLAENRTGVNDPGVRPGVTADTEPVPGVNLEYFANLRAGFKEAYSIAGGVVGRFGWKAQYSALSRFAGEAYDTEMGVFNSYSPQPREPLVEECLSIYGAPYDDPTNYAGSYGSDMGEPVFVSTEFMRYLNPARPVEAFPGASAQSIERGSLLFNAVGCALCPTPSLPTGQLSNVSAVNNSVAHLYSDLLLHHVGPGLADGIAQGAAGLDEFRTAPLWGLGQRVFFLHDGRTSDLLTATQEHKSSASEAGAVVDRFNALILAERQHVLNFLRSL